MFAPKSSSTDDGRDAFVKISLLESLSTDDDLDIVWRKAVDNFRDVSKANVSGKKITMRDVLANVNSQNADNTTKTRAKGIVMNILSCIQIFGEVVGSASTAAFPASQQCFNALNSVIVAVKTYQKIFEDLTVLLERVSVFLGSLRIHFEEKTTDVKLDKRLRWTVYRVLEHFMGIMTLAIELMNRKSRIKLAAKEFFFGGTSGVTDALATLETLVSDCVRIQVAVIGQDLSEAARGIRTLDGKIDVLGGKMESILSNMERRDEREGIQDVQNQIREWLQIKKGEPWRNHHDTISSQRIKDTGDWLCKKHDDFTQWCDTETDGRNVMIVTSGPGRGKSFLASAVIDHIKDSKIDSEGLTLLAYSYLQTTVREEAKEQSHKDSKQNSHGKTEPTGQAATSALYNIVWQLCKLDEDYQDFVFHNCKGDECIMNAIRIWNDYILAYNPRGKSTFFIVLDGMQREDRKLLEALLQRVHEQTSQLRIRVFVTAETQIIPRNAETDTSLWISLDPAPNLKRSVCSIDDVKKIVDYKLVNTSIFSQKNVSNRRVQQEVLDVLSREIQNDFPRLNLVINEIGQCVNSRQIERILKRAEEPIEVKLARQIRSLNSKLAGMIVLPLI